MSEATVEDESIQDDDASNIVLPSVKADYNDIAITFDPPPLIWDYSNNNVVQEDLEMLKTELREQKALISDLKEEVKKSRRTNNRRTTIHAGLFTSLLGSDRNNPDETKLPSDIYSFFVCSKILSKEVLFGMAVFLLQVTIYVLLGANQVHRHDEDNNYLRFPANVEFSVRVTQFICIGIAVLTQEDIREALQIVREGYYSEGLQAAFNDISQLKWWYACSLRFFEGALGLLVTLFLIIQADDVIDLLLNFTAIEFVSALDNVAFELAVVGFFGSVVREKSELILETSYNVPIARKAESWYHSFLLLMVFICMLFGWSVVVHRQRHGALICKQIYVQFGDEAAAELGAYTGLYTIESNVVKRNNDRVRYTKENTFLNTSSSFGYCKRQESWGLFLDDNDVCDEWLAKSSETTTFDMLETVSSPWNAFFPGSDYGVQIDHFRLTCVDEDHNDLFCKKDLCRDDNMGNAYGLYYTPIDDTSIDPPCRTLEVNDDSDTFVGEDYSGSDDIISKKFKIFLDGNNSFQVYYSPVYVPEDKRLKDTVIFFGGRRWYFAENIGVDNTDATQLKESIRRAVQNPSYISLISEAVDIISLKDVKTPLGLQWYRPDKFGKKNKFKAKTSQRLPLPDTSQPVDTFFTCAFCDNETNACSYEGVCNSKDGTCECKNGATGSLCTNMPTGNGQCDPFFNTAEYEYDGGDCCQAGGDFGDITSAFNQTFTDIYGKGYPNCIDPDMVNITIYFYRNTGGVGVYLDLVCKEATYLRFPFGVLDSYTSEIEGYQTVSVKDGSDCSLQIRLRDERPDIGDVTVACNYIVCLGDRHCNNDNDVLKLAGNNKTVDLNGNQETFKEDFLVSSLWQSLSTLPVSNETLLMDSTSPQGKAIRLLSSVQNDRTSSDSPYLAQIYGLFVLNYATGGWLLPIIQGAPLSLDEYNECDIYLYVGCENGTMTSINLADQSFHGTLPPEILLLSTLETFSLAKNNISGSIPSEIGSLTNLRKLDMRYNAITGTIPTSIGEMTGLTHLDLSYNGFKGSIPNTIGNLLHLERLVIENSTLTGSIPVSVGKLTNLKELDVEKNSLRGHIPDLSNSRGLVELDLESNDLTGSIPDWLGTLTELKILILSKNQNITGTIPTALCEENGEVFVYVDCNDSNYNETTKETIFCSNRTEYCLGEDCGANCTPNQSNHFQVGY